MTKYNWDERHIITFPEKELALETKDLHVYYGQKEAGKPDGYTKQFLDYMMSDEVQENVVSKMGYISIHSMKVTKDADGKVTKKSEE